MKPEKMEKTPLAKRFTEEADKWYHETMHLSSPTQMMLHSSYQAILRLASEDKKETIGLMLKDLKANGRPWFWALSYLTNENPINPVDFGKTEKMIKAWVRWGEQNGYFSTIKK
jgi:hypothetical protein